MTRPIPPLEILKQRIDFRPDVLHIMIGGHSTIDSNTAFQVSNLEEATGFIENYGYDLEDPIERAELLGNFHEALNFIRKHFLQPENADGLKLEIPRKILELTDVRELLLMVEPFNKLTHWACALLKVMHTIAHMDKDLRTGYFAEIQKQILDRFYRSIHRDAEGTLFLGDRPEDPFRVNLVAFETKPKKARDSIILKLLHKSENVAEDIFDRVGIRFITPTALDALLVIKTLKDKRIVMAPNVKPSRSRNTLIDLEDFQKRLLQLQREIDEAQNEPFDETHWKERLSQLTPEKPSPSIERENPHTSQYYRAIQFTCRQLIKLRNPLFDDLRELKNKVKLRPLDEDYLKTIERMDLKYTQREVRFFYPFEVQVVDRRNWEENEKGRSAHSEYKRSQVQAALKRVMGPLRAPEYS